MPNENDEIKRAVEALMLKMSGRDWSYQAREAALEIFEPAIGDAFEHLGFERPDNMAARAAMLARSRLNLTH